MAGKGLGRKKKRGMVTSARSSSKEEVMEKRRARLSEAIREILPDPKDYGSNYEAYLNEFNSSACELFVEVHKRVMQRFAKMETKRVKLLMEEKVGVPSES